MRYFAFIEYFGTYYCGWQKQKGRKSVQGIVEECFKKTFKKSIKILASSRTDAGVHAYKNCFHFDLDFEINAEKIKKIMNRILPVDITILDIFNVKENANARFSAKKRFYNYILKDSRNSFKIGLWYEKVVNLDVDKMNEAAKYLIGEKNFEAFSKKNINEKHDYKCIVYSAFWRYKENDLIFEISANRFLYNMIRSLVKSLLLIGEGKLSINRFQNVLKNKERNNVGLAPARGLVLINIEYIDDILPSAELV